VSVWSVSVWDPSCVVDKERREDRGADVVRSHRRNPIPIDLRFKDSSDLEGSYPFNSSLFFTHPSQSATVSGRGE